MLEGEGAGLGTSQPKGAQILNIDVPFDGLGLISIPASETISPVFTMWITLVAMYTGELTPGPRSCHQPPGTLLGLCDRLNDMLHIRAKYLASCNNCKGCLLCCGF